MDPNVINAMGLLLLPIVMSMLTLAYFLGRLTNKVASNDEFRHDLKDSLTRIFNRLDGLPCSARDERNKALEKRVEVLESEYQRTRTRIHEIAAAVPLSGMGVQP